MEVPEQDLPLMEEDQDRKLLNKLERWDFSVWRIEGSGEIFSRCVNIWCEGVKMREPDSSEWCPPTGQEKMNTRNSISTENYFLLWGWSNTGIGIQIGCGVTSIGDIQNLAGQAPGLLALSDPAWAGKLVKMISRGSLQPKCFPKYVKLLLFSMCVTNGTEQTFLMHTNNSMNLYRIWSSSGFK